MSKYTRRNEQVSEGSSREDANSFWWGYLPTQVEFPFPEGEPSGQLQRCRAERLTKLNLKTTGNRIIRNSSIISTGLNSQQKISWLCFSTARARWVCLTPSVATRVGLQPWGIFSSAALLPSSSFSFNSRQRQNAAWRGHSKERFLYRSFWEAGKKYLTPLWQISRSLTAVHWRPAADFTVTGKVAGPRLERGKKKRKELVESSNHDPSWGWKKKYGHTIPPQTRFLFLKSRVTPLSFLKLFGSTPLL